MKLFVSALEVSSNIHLKYLLHELNKIENITLCGIFSSDVSSAPSLFTPNEFCIMGFSDVFIKLPFFIKAKKKALKLALQADKVLLMDSSSFNLPLAKEIKKISPNKEIMYYILPQAWAWKPWRANILSKYCDKLAGILPFEISIYESRARFIGHPLLDEIKYFKKKPIIKSNIITFMPGSRLGEIRKIFPIFREFKNILKQIDSSLIFNLVVPCFFDYKNLYKIYGNYDDFNISKDAHKSIYESKIAFICSGTATLECALIGTPFVLCYKAKKIDELIIRLFIKVKHIGLANIIFEKMGEKFLFHNELLQDSLNTQKLLEEYYFLNQESSQDSFLEKSQIIRSYLQTGSASNVAKWLLR